ncbi:MAG: RsmB/NOP family class I SAM-dependent RNA methyltransferase [Rhodothermales bacterium]
MKRPDILAAERLERYRSIVPDWQAFLESLSRPLPLCLWTNTLISDRDEVARHLEREGIEVRPVNWLPGAFKGPPSKQAGRALPFLAGLYHIQEEVSLLPVWLLEPEPSERVIDLCSAPGNKTAQMAAAMKNTGAILGNDRDAMRTRATRGILDRLGVVNTTIVTSDAGNLPDGVGRFDRVLADVPCTCEGTTRKHVDALLQSGRDASLRLHRRQLAILRKAVQLCRTGGRIAYATCTYAPEENEMVVDAVLREFGGEVEMVPARVDGLECSSGLTTWGERAFDESLEQSMRIWPHQNDTGGFFVALLQKRSHASAAPRAHDRTRESSPADSRSNFGTASVPTSGANSMSTSTANGPSNAESESLPGLLAPDERRKWTDLLTRRFGIPPETLAAVTLHQPNNKYVAVVSNDHAIIARPDPVSIGMPLIRVGLRYPKLTTAGARLLGRHATKNVLDVSTSQARDYMRRVDFYPTANQMEQVMDTGYVIVRFEGAALGVGLYLDEVGRVRSMFPKVLANAARS